MSPLAAAILQVLGAEAPGQGVSLPRLGKRLGQGASVLMRELSLMGDATLGGTPGPGWVQVTLEDNRWTVRLTPQGAAQLASLPAVVSGVRAHAVTVLQAGQPTAGTDWLAEEVPVALVFNGISHAVMMATPADLEDFALGFALTEGLLTGPDELRGVDVTETPLGIELQLEVSSECEWRLKERRRTLAGRTGCGLCGTDSLEQVRLGLPHLPPLAVKADVVAAAVAAMADRQPRQQLTGATHAAALCAPDGSLRLVREDVGRHNALDKLIGALRREGLDPARHFIAVTSRASFEMVQKTALAGVPVLAAVSAPTAMAVDMAVQCQMLLMGFVRGEGLVVYAGHLSP